MYIRFVAEKIPYSQSCGTKVDPFYKKLSKQKLILVDCGSDFSFGIDKNGKLFGWGRKLFLGQYDDGSQLEPIQIEQFADHNCIQVSCGEGNNLHFFFIIFTVFD